MFAERPDRCRADLKVFALSVVFRDVCDSFRPQPPLESKCSCPGFAYGGLPSALLLEYRLATLFFPAPAFGIGFLPVGPRDLTVVLVALIGGAFIFLVTSSLLLVVLPGVFLF